MSTPHDVIAPAPRPLAVSEDPLLGGKLRLRQPVRGHKAGTDAILLAAAVPPGQGRTIVDLGAGTGVVGLILALREASARVILVERDHGMAALADENAGLNGLGAQVRVVRADIAAPARQLAAAGLAAGMADLVVSNPPFLVEGQARSSPLAQRRAAHVQPDAAALDVWIGAARRLLKPRGKLVVIHRADHLPQLLAACSGRFGGICLLPVYPKAARPAIRIILTGTAQSKAPAAILPGLILQGDDGRFTPRSQAIHQGEAGLA